MKTVHFGRDVWSWVFYEHLLFPVQVLFGCYPICYHLWD